MPQFINPEGDAVTVNLYSVASLLTAWIIFACIIFYWTLILRCFSCCRPTLMSPNPNPVRRNSLQSEDTELSQITVDAVQKQSLPVVQLIRREEQSERGRDGGSDCAICLGEFEEGEGLRLLPNCSHVFHVQCIDAWLSSNTNCPLCRTKVDYM